MLDKSIFVAEIKKLGYVYQHFTLGNTLEEIKSKLEAWYEIFADYDEADFYAILLKRSNKILHSHHKVLLI
jgi:hypothetical protein